MVWGPLTTSNLNKCWRRFGSILGSLVVYASGLKVASRLLQVWLNCFKLAYLNQSGSNLSQVGANMGLTWVQDEPTWSQLGTKMGPDWRIWFQYGCRLVQVIQPEAILTLPWGLLRHTRPEMPNLSQNEAKFISKMMKCWHFQRHRRAKFIGKCMSGSKSRKNDHEAKTYRFGGHLEAILASSWGTWEAFGGHFGRLGANLSQHRAIWSHLGANWRSP